MSGLRTLDLDDVIAGAAAALSRARGRTVLLSDAHLLSGPERRNLIARARVDDDENARSVIVKATRASHYDHAAENILETSGLAREWVATALLAAHAPARRGALLAADAAAGILVFDDLASVDSLVESLLHGGPEEAERALLLYAAALGRLHAETAGCRAAHRATLRAIFPAARPRERSEPLLADDARRIAARLGHALAADEVAALSARLTDPGPWQVLVHGDPCPDNALIVDGGMCLIDYEYAHVSHALLDGIYWRMGFPTCWCAGRVPDDVAARVDAAYRAALARAIADAGDDGAYRLERAYVTAARLIIQLAWLLDRALAGDERWGIATVRGRLLWYLDFALGVIPADLLPGVTAAARAWRADLRNRWPDAAPLGLYPAFAGVTEA